MRLVRADQRGVPAAGLAWRGVLLLTTCLAGSAAGLRFAIAAAGDGDGDAAVTATTTFTTADGGGDVTAATAIPFDPEGLGAIAEESTTAVPSGGRWVQRIRPVVRSEGPPAAARTPYPTAAGPALMLPFGRAIADALYGTPWPASRATPKCAADVKIYNEHAKNFTLWAAKSE